VIAEETPLSPSRIVELLGQALAALDEAHAAGRVHRDFKPENIFVETLRTGRSTSRCSTSASPSCAASRTMG